MKDCRTLNLLMRPGSPTLLVSLPANDVELAQAAVDGGAEGLKVHLNVQRAAAKVRFGTFTEERAALERIIALGLPVGIVPGDEAAMATPGELSALAAMGLDFADAYLSAMPAWMLAQDDLPIMAAVGHDDMPHPERLRALAQLPQVRMTEHDVIQLCFEGDLVKSASGYTIGAEMIEASIIDHGGYGRALSASDLCDYTGVTRAMHCGGPDAQCGKPIIVTTQRRILPEDLAALAAIGVRGLLIGAIVTGRDPDSLRLATARYREALQHL